MTKQEEIKLNHRLNQEMKSQRTIPNGRNFLWNSYCWKNQKDFDNYRNNFDRIFPCAPGVGI